MFRAECDLFKLKWFVRMDLPFLVLTIGCIICPRSGRYLIIIKYKKVCDTGERVANEEFEQTALVPHHDAGGNAVWTTTTRMMVVCGRR